MSHASNDSRRHHHPSHALLQHTRPLPLLLLMFISFPGDFFANILREFFPLIRVKLLCVF
jgi:hypothetical protein